MKEREKLRIYLSALEEDLKKLVTSPLLEEGAIPATLLSELNNCCAKAREYCNQNHLADRLVLQNALAVLWPVVALTTSSPYIETHKEPDIQKQFEICAFQLMKIDMLARDNGISFHKMAISKQEHSVYSWVNQLQHYFTEIDIVVAQLPERIHSKIRPSLEKIGAVPKILQEFLDCPTAEEAWGRKNETFRKLEDAFDIRRHLPREIELALQNMWAVLEDHAPPPVISQEVSGTNRGAQVARGVFFSSHLPEQLTALESNIAYLQHKGVFKSDIARQDFLDIAVALEKIKNLSIDPIWHKTDKEKQIWRVSSILKELATIMPKLELNVAITESTNQDILRAYEATWCIAKNMANNADLQYNKYGHKEPKSFPQHPFVVAMTKAVERVMGLTSEGISLINFERSVKVELDAFIESDEVAQALDKKYKAVEQIIWTMVNDCPPKMIQDLLALEQDKKWYKVAQELDFITTLLMHHGNPELRERIAASLDYSRQLQTYSFSDKERPTSTKLPVVYNLLEVAAKMTEVAHCLAKEPDNLQAKWYAQAERLERISSPLHSLKSLDNHPDQKTELIAGLTEVAKMIDTAPPGPLHYLSGMLRIRIDNIRRELGDHSVAKSDRC